MTDEPYDAVILAGGSARRLGGVDKPGAVVGGRTLLNRVLAAVADAERTIVVGPERSTYRPVNWQREAPPGAGPVPALAAGLAGVTADLVVVLAADLPFLERAAVRRLLAGIGSAVGAVLVDGSGAGQWLVGAWRTAALRPAVTAATGGSLRAVMGPLLPALVAGAGDGVPPWFDCDTPADLERARALA